MPGIEYFAELKSQGILNPSRADDKTILSGETPIVLDWTYNWPGRSRPSRTPASSSRSAVPERRRVRLVLRPGRRRDSSAPQRRAAVDRAHPSDEGALGYLEGGAIPARYATLVENGVITEDMLTNLPPAELIEQISVPDG